MENLLPDHYGPRLTNHGELEERFDAPQERLSHSEVDLRQKLLEDTAMRQSLPIVEPNAVRGIPRSFGWADHAVRSYLKLLRPTEIALYFFLILAADAQGLSCWRIERIARELGDLDWDGLFQARETLTSMGLVAFRPWSEHCVDGVYQVLPISDKTQGAQKSPFHVQALPSDPREEE